MKLSDIDIKKFGNTINLVGSIYEGEGHTLLCFFPGETADGSSAVTLDMTPGDWETLLRQTDLMETEVLQKAKDGMVVKAIVRKCQRNLDQGVSWRVFKRDGYQCRYCGADNLPLTIDHLVLWEEGGPTTEANLVAACRKCNKTRGNTQYADWLKHPFYLGTSKRLSAATRAANEAVLGTLDKIPRLIHVKSR